MAVKTWLAVATMLVTSIRPPHGRRLRMLVIIMVGIAMTLVLCIAGPVATLLAVGHRRKRRAARDPLTQVFRARELRQLDAHLEEVAREERRRLESELARYLAGRAGHVVLVLKAPNGIALELSDGRRLALRGISYRNVEMLHRRAPVDMLRPECVDRDAGVYGLLLRGPAGKEVKVYARNIALAV